MHPDRHDDERPEPLALLDRGVLSEVGRRDARGVQGAARGVHEHPGRGGAVQRRAHVRPVPSAALPGARRVHARFVPGAPGLRGPDARATARPPPTRWSSASATSSASSRRWDSPAISSWCGTSSRTRGARGSRSGPGRGSSAGSLVAYCLGITNVDPIRYGLHLRALSEPRADLDARHGHRLRRRPPRRGDPLRRRPLRRRPRRPHHHVRDHGRQGGAPRRGARPRLLLRRGRPHREAHPELPAQHLARRVAREGPGARGAGQARSSRDRAVERGQGAGGLHAARLRARLRGRDLGRAAHGARAAVQGPQAARADHRARHGSHREARAAQDGLPRPEDPHGDRAMP